MESLVAFGWWNKNSKVGGADNMYSRKLLELIFICVLTGSMVVAQAPVSGTMAVTGGGAKAGMVTMHVDDMDVESAKGAPFVPRSLQSIPRRLPTVTGFIQLTAPLSVATAKAGPVARPA